MPTSTHRPLGSSASLTRHFTVLNSPEISDNWAIVMAMAFAGTCLSASNGGGARAIFCFLLSVAFLVVIYPAAAVKGNMRNAILWAYPAWTIFSIGWSTAPDRTLHSVALLIPTIFAGLALGGSRKQREVNLGAAMAMFVFIAAAVASGGRTTFSDTGSGGEALTGFGSGKNFFGHLAAMSTILSFSFFAFPRSRFARLLFALGVLDFAVSAFATLGAHATGSILACIIAIGVIALVISFAKVSWQLRVLLLAGALGIIVLYVAFGTEIQTMLFETVLKKFNKDSSLTGRTTLWDYADRLMADHRMLGYGYGTFWQVTNPDAWTLWRMMGVEPNSGFNFHNTARETLIESGLGGFIIYVASFGWAFVRTFFRSLPKGDLTSGIRLGFIVYFIVRMPVESTGFGGITMDTILLTCFLSVPLLTGPRPRSEHEQSEPAPSLRYAT